MAIFYNVRVGEMVKIDGPATVTLLKKDGQRSTLKIETDPNVKVKLIQNSMGPVVARRGITS